MRRILFSLVTAVAVLAGCDGSAVVPPDWSELVPGSETPDTPDNPDNPDTPNPSGEDYPDRTDVPVLSDMVLLYGGSRHRSPVDWSSEIIDHYVRYIDEEGKSHWLFDSFLCLEFVLQYKDASKADKCLVTGYTDANGNAIASASKEDWEFLIDYYFKSGSGIDAIEKAVADAAKVMGDPPTKRKVVVGMPEPIVYLYNNRWTVGGTGGTVYWGEVDGRDLDFSLSNDRFKASKWFIDRVRERFLEKNYQYIELAGFYCVAEKSTHVKSYLPDVGVYLRDRKYCHSWIPYFTAEGYSIWKSLGFSQAFLQPNYFFDSTLDVDRLYDATRMANDAKMGLEIEFDGNAKNKQGREKLRNYMIVAKSQGFWENTGIAYYQGSWALQWLKQGTAEDKQLYHELCQWIISRPFRSTAGVE